VRHHADAIFGMQLENIGDAMLGSLNSIYGWVMAEGLARTLGDANDRRWQHD
jgi:hypothetical protein